jgi:hypothetical protein
MTPPTRFLEADVYGDEIETSRLPLSSPFQWSCCRRGHTVAMGEVFTSEKAKRAKS